MEAIGSPAAGIATAPSQRLLERASELAAIGDALGAAAGGAGACVVLEGPPGLGKTTLLQATRAAAIERGLTVLSARAAELEEAFSFGVALQLFAGAVARVDAAERERLLAGAAAHSAPLFGSAPAAEGIPDEEQSFALFHGLHWLTANLAERAPLVLAVDDAHWADLPSLRFLHYLLQRLDELPVALVVAARPERERRQGRLVQRLAGSPVTTALRLDPLSPRAVSALVRLTLDDHASDELCRACAEATGGNPYYVGELVAALGASGTTDPTAVASLTTDAVAAAVLARLAGLPAEAGALAAAVAVLGDEAPLGAAAELAAIDADAAPGLADALAGVALLAPGTPLRFAHPIARRAVYDDLPPAGRADLHKRAAMALVGADADPELVASHVLAAVAETERWATPALRRAAERAGERGAHEEAARYLRAMLDSAPAADRAALLRDLALAEARSHDERAADRADAALDAAQEQPLEVAAAAIALGRTLIDHGHHTDATRIFARGLAAIDGMPEAAELAMTLRASRVGAGGLAGAAVAGDERATLLARAGTGTTTRAERLGLAHAAVATGLAGENAAETVALARAAVAGLDESGATTLSATVVLLAAIALISADALDEAERLCTLLADDARRRGSVRIFATASHARAHALHRQGNLVGAIADAESALDAARYGWRLALPAAHAALAACQLERGELAAAQAALALPGGEERWEHEFTYNDYLEARGRVRLAEGDAAAALSDFEACGERLAQVGATQPGVVPWRSGAARAAAALGDRERARALADEDLAEALRFGAPLSHGLALRTAGELAGGDRGIDLLREAVEVLAGSEGRLEHAQALASLGATLLAAGHRVAAREPLREALDLAHRCGAAPVQQRVRDHLVAAGARPRRPSLSGVDALTPRERRIATMAAEGLSNREIAEALFITTKTVETHLRHAYAKLGVENRLLLADLFANLQA
jgi:predicted ATPase/DNA-binding CsgD family transcriptional regulator